MRVEGGLAVAPRDAHFDQPGIGAVWSARAEGDLAGTPRRTRFDDPGIGAVRSARAEGGVAMAQRDTHRVARAEVQPTPGQQ
jgi:hypothetical protein